MIKIKITMNYTKTKSFLERVEYYIFLGSKKKDI